MEWLVSAGLVVRVRNASKAEHPLNAYALTNVPLYLAARAGDILAES